MFVYNSVIYIWGGFQNNNIKDILPLFIFWANLALFDTGSPCTEKLWCEIYASFEARYGHEYHYNSQ